MSRRKKFFLNTFMAIIKQVVTVICGFILPRYMLIYYGSSINGLVSSISNFLGFISLLDMGVGAVIQANLYKPLSEKDTLRISQIVISSERFFRHLAYIFLCYILVLCLFLPNIYESNYNFIFTVTLIIIISISTLAQYLFGMTYQILLNADQKLYIPFSLQIITIIINTILAILLMKMGMSIHIVKLMTATVYVLRPLGQMLYVHKNYVLNKKIKITEEPIKQKWNGFSQHLAAVICQNVDIAVLSMFSTLQNVSIYTVYYNIAYGIEQIVITASSGLEALFGSLIARNEQQKLLNFFYMAEWIAHTSVTFIFSVVAFTIVPFVSVYTKGINDANYIAPLFGFTLVAAYAFQCLRAPYFSVIKAAGHFKQTQIGAYISAILNIIITIGFVFKFGLIGAALGTLVAMLYHTCYFVWHLKNNIIYLSLRKFVLYLITDLLIVIVSFFFIKPITLVVSSYFTWAILAMKISIVVLLITIVINLIFYKKQIFQCFNILKNRNSYLHKNN